MWSRLWNRQMWLVLHRKEGEWAGGKPAHRRGTVHGQEVAELATSELHMQIA